MGGCLFIGIHLMAALLFFPLLIITIPLHIIYEQGQGKS